MKKPALTILILGLVLGVCAMYGILKGAADIPWNDLLSGKNNQILNLRVARVLLGIFAGMGLGVCGVALQAVLRNPLAEPYLLGTSGGAGLGAVIAITLNLSSVYFPAAAFAGAVASLALVYLFALQNGKISAQSLILSGVIVGMLLSGIIVFLVSISSRAAMHGMMWWLLGSLQVYDYKLLSIVGIIVISGTSIVFFFAQDLNAMSLGEEEALHLGVNIEKMKKMLLILTSLITGALVSVSGIIGFVGLVIPHTIRLVTGPNHKILIPAVILASAAFLVFCDTLARSVFAPVEIPIGVITSLIGTPVFIALLRRKQKINI